MSRRLEDYRAQYVYKVLDAAMTARPGSKLHPDASSRGFPADAGSPRYRRAQKMVGVAASVCPGILDALLKRSFRPESLPFQSEGLELLSFGSGSTVFLVRRGASAGGRPLVLKMWRRSLGRNLDELQRQAGVRRGVHERIARWYVGVGVTLPTAFLILHGPVLGGPAVACIQPHVEVQVNDIFQDLEEDDLIRLLLDRPLLGEQFRLFTDRTLHFARVEGACVDLNGYGNIVLEADLGIRLLDYGIFEFEVKKQRAPDSVDEMHQRFALMERVREALPPGTATHGTGAGG